jgi:serine protease Do
MKFVSLSEVSLAALLLSCAAPARPLGATPAETSPAPLAALAQAVPASSAVPVAQSAAALQAGPVSPDFATVAQRIVPSVVSIRVEQRAKQSRGEGSFSGDPRGFGPFQPAPGFMLPNPGPREGLGSGFVIDSSGLILTNYHVVEGADEIEVNLGTPDGPHETLAAHVVGKAPDFDVALLQTERKLDTPALALGDSDKLRVGEWVMAIGNPFGLSQSMSVGIVSAKHREDVNPSGQRGVYDFLQTDASINPGNSGGPLVDMNGRVVGMNTAISAQGSGIGFAIPSSILSRIFPRLRDNGELNRSWLGVQIQPLTADLAQSYGLPNTQGALVADVVAGSPAEKAGLHAGDVITRFDGKVLNNSAELPLWVSLSENGKKVDVDVWRNGHAESARIELASFPDKDPAVAHSEQPSGGFGLQIQTLTLALRERLGLNVRQGVIVTGVEPGSLGARAGLREGDVITDVQGQEVADAEQLAQTLHGLRSGQVVRLQVRRGDSKTFVALKKP